MVGCITGKFAGFSALETPAGIHEATGEDIFAPSVQRSHAVPRSERYNPFPLAVEKWITGNNGPINAGLFGCEGCVEFGF